MLWNFKVAKLFKINKIKLNIITGVKNLFDEKYASMILINAKGFGGENLGIIIQVFQEIILYL